MASKNIEQIEKQSGLYSGVKEMVSEAVLFGKEIREWFLSRCYLIEEFAQGNDVIGLISREEYSQHIDAKKCLRCKVLSPLTEFQKDDPIQVEQASTARSAINRCISGQKSSIVI